MTMPPTTIFRKRTFIDMRTSITENARSHIIPSPEGAPFRDLRLCCETDNIADMGSFLASYVSGAYQGLSSQLFMELKSQQHPRCSLVPPDTLNIDYLLSDARYTV